MIKRVFEWCDVCLRRLGWRAIGFLLAALPLQVSAQWTWRSPPGGGNTLRGVATSGSLFVAVGDVGAVVTSADAVTWSSRASGSTARLNGVAFGGGRWVAVGDAGVVLSSADGSNWQPQSSGSASALNAVIWTGTEFCAVGASGVVLHSADGNSWTVGSASSATNLRGVATSGSIWIAVGDGGKILTSANGTAWSAVSSGTTATLNSVAWTGATFVAVGATGTVLTSVTGTSWTAQYSPARSDLTGVARSGTVALAVAAPTEGAELSILGSNTAVITAGTSASSWTRRRAGTQNGLFAIAGNGTRVVAVGAAGTISSSTNNGISWTNRTTDAEFSFSAIGWDGAQFLAVGRGIRSSADGATWTSRATTGDFAGACWNGRQWVAVGSYGQILGSYDGSVWLERDAPTTSALNDVIWGGDRFVAVGASGTVLTSNDGGQWTLRTGATSETLRGVAYNGLKFVAVGDGGVVVASADGATWATVSSGTSTQLNSVSWTGAQFVAVGANGVALRSVDGNNWTPLPLPTARTLRRVMRLGQYTFILGDEGVILRSADEVAWEALASGTTNELRGAATDGARIVVAGVNGTLLSSDVAPGEISSLSAASVQVNESGGMVALTVGGTTAWEAVETLPWMTVSPVAGTGSATVNVTIAAAPAGRLRTGVLSVGGRTINVRQGPAVAVRESGRVLGAAAQQFSIEVDSDEAWTAQSDASWVWVGRPAGTGRERLTVAVDANTSGVDRAATIAISGSSFAVTQSAAATGEVWTPRNPLPQSRTIYSLAASPTRWVGVGENGAIISSADGVNWTSPVPASDWLFSVAWGAGRFVAVGSYGAVFTSDDGLVWEKRFSDTGGRLWSVLWDGTQFVAYGDATLTSSDGIRWTVRVAPSNSGQGTVPSGIAARAGRLVAVSGYNVSVSTNGGVSWSSSSLFPNSALNGVAANNSVFVAVGDNGNIYASADGVSWTQRTPPTYNVIYWAVTWTGNLFVAVGTYGQIATSPDGIAWTARTSGVADALTAVAANGGEVVAAGTSGALIKSATGASWNRVGTSAAAAASTSASVTAICWNGAEFLAAQAYSDTWLVSSDGVTWTSRAIPNRFVYDLVWNGSRYLGVTDGGSISSADGLTWTSASMPLGQYYGVAWSGGKFLAVGYGGHIASSADGSSWSSQVSGTTASLNSVAWNGSLAVAVGTGGTIVTSPDGVTWTTRASGTASNLFDVAWGGGAFVAVGAAGTVVVSADGVSWTAVPTLTTRSLASVTWGAGIFFASEPFTTSDPAVPRIFASSDGNTWTTIASGVSVGELVYGSDRFVGGGASAGIVSSDVGAPLILRQPVSVQIRAGGSATFSVSAGGVALSYQWRKGEAPIPGATAATLTLPNATVAAAGDYSVIVSGNGLSVTSATAALVVTSPFDEWVERSFSTAQREDAAVAGVNADPDHDGLSNLMEYALGREPLVAEAMAATTTSNDGTDWIFTYTRPADRTDVTYAVEVSTDLATWTTSGVTHARTVAGATETWQGRVAMAGRPQVFFRLKVSQP